MEEGLNAIRSEGFEVFGANLLKKGISAYLTGEADSVGRETNASP